MSTWLKLNSLVFVTAIPALLHSLWLRIPSGKYCERSWWTVAPPYILMHYMTIITRGLIMYCVEYELNEILTSCSNSRCLGEIWQFVSYLLPVWCVLSVNSVNVDITWMSNMNFCWKLTIVITWLPCLFRIAKAVQSNVEPFNLVPPDSVNLFNFEMCSFARNRFRIELVPYCHEWRRSWWPMTHIMSGLPVSILQCR